MRRLGLFLLLWSAVLPTQAAVLLHAFNWPYATVAERAAEIRALGYDGVLVSSPLRSEGNDWWMRYQPQDYRVIDHPLGDTSAFLDMERALTAAGLTLYADLVLNHMANEASQRADLNYPGSRVLQVYATNIERHTGLRLYGDLSANLFTAADFHPAFCINNYADAVQVQTGRLCSGNGDPGLPDLAETPNVVAQQRLYVAALIAAGVDGFRVDAAKHMTTRHFEAVLSPDLIGDRPVIGEIITGGGTGNGEFSLFLQPWLAQTPFGAYDFPLFHRIRSAFSFGGDLSSMLRADADGQAIDPARAWTFAVNHDIPLNGIFRGLLMDATDESLAWAWLIGSGRGTPLVYSDNNESGDNRWRDLYRRADIAAALRFHRSVAGSDTGTLDSSNCHILVRRGQRGILAINKCGEPRALRVASQGRLHPQRAYREVRDGERIRVVNDELLVTLPARSARLWLLDSDDNGCGSRTVRRKEGIRCLHDEVPAETGTPRGGEPPHRAAPPRTGESARETWE